MTHYLGKDKERQDFSLEEKVRAGYRETFKILKKKIL